MAVYNHECCEAEASFNPHAANYPRLEAPPGVIPIGATATVRSCRQGVAESSDFTSFGSIAKLYIFYRIFLIGEFGILIPILVRMVKTGDKIQWSNISQGHTKSLLTICCKQAFYISS